MPRPTTNPKMMIINNTNFETVINPGWILMIRAKVATLPVIMFITGPRKTTTATIFGIKIVKRTCLYVDLARVTQLQY